MKTQAPVLCQPDSFFLVLFNCDQLDTLEEKWLRIISKVYVI